MKPTLTVLSRNYCHLCEEMIAALQQLPVDQQMLLELHYWEDQDISSLAEVFDVPPTTIRTRLHRACKALREVVGKIAPPGALDTDETMDRWIKNSPRA